MSAARLTREARDHRPVSSGIVPGERRGLLPPGQTMKLLVCLAAHATLVTALFDDPIMTNPCEDEGVACAGDTDCMQLTMSQYMMGTLDMYEPTMYDMAECGTNNLCAAMMECGMWSMPCGTEMIECFLDSECGWLAAATETDNTQWSACMGNNLCASMMNCMQNSQDMWPEAEPTVGGEPIPRTPCVCDDVGLCSTFDDGAGGEDAYC
eukprot:COSAG04_NODE_7325_length_1143_cov_0.997137_1_plen_208_part_01